MKKLINTAFCVGCLISVLLMIGLMLYAYLSIQDGKSVYAVVIMVVSTGLFLLGLIFIFYPKNSELIMLYRMCYLAVAIALGGVLFLATNAKALEYSLQTVTKHDEQTLVMSYGVLTPLTLVTFEFYRLSNPEIKQIAVTGPGGDTLVAKYLKSIIQDNKYKVIAYGNVCNSSCTVILSGGVKKEVQSKTTLGFHQTCLPLGACAQRVELYDGMFTTEIIEILTQPGGDEICEVSSTEFNILNNPQHADYRKTIATLEEQCKRS